MIKGKKEIEIKTYVPNYCSAVSSQFIWDVPENVTAEQWFNSLSASEKASLCSSGSSLCINIRNDFGVNGSVLCSRYYVNCADYRK